MFNQHSQLMPPCFVAVIVQLFLATSVRSYYKYNGQPLRMGDVHCPNITARPCEAFQNGMQKSRTAFCVPYPEMDDCGRFVDLLYTANGAVAAYKSECACLCCCSFSRGWPHSFEKLFDMQKTMPEHRPASPPRSLPIEKTPEKERNDDAPRGSCGQEMNKQLSEQLKHEHSTYPNAFSEQIMIGRKTEKESAKTVPAAAHDAMLSAVDSEHEHPKKGNESPSKSEESSPKRGRKSSPKRDDGSPKCDKHKSPERASKNKANFSRI